MGTYLLRRLVIAVPSLLGISVILFTVLALAPGDRWPKRRNGSLERGSYNLRGGCEGSGNFLFESAVTH